MTVRFNAKPHIAPVDKNGAASSDFKLYLFAVLAVADRSERSTWVNPVGVNVKPATVVDAFYCFALGFGDGDHAAMLLVVGCSIINK
jgi:hypothetical protein